MLAIKEEHCSGGLLSQNVLVQNLDRKQHVLKALLVWSNRVYMKFSIYRRRHPIFNSVLTLFYTQQCHKSGASEMQIQMLTKSTFMFIRLVLCFSIQQFHVPMETITKIPITTVIIVHSVSANRSTST